MCDMGNMQNVCLNITRLNKLFMFIEGKVTNSATSLTLGPQMATTKVSPLYLGKCHRNSINPAALIREVQNKSVCANNTIWSH